MSQSRTSIVLVDDDPEIAQAVVNYLDPERYRIHVVGDGAQVLSTVREANPDAIILDVHLPSMSGLDLLHLLKSERPRTPVIIVSGYVSTDNAIEAMKTGAFEYLAKPFRLAELERVLGRAIGYAETPPGPMDDEDVPLAGDQILGKSPEMVAVAKTIGQISQSDAPILLTGESGVGKELVARTIHRSSSRSAMPFHIVNCSAASPSQLEAELFGQSGQPVAGAPRSKRGKLEQAEGGTIFLDEIDDLSLLAQSRLFQILEDGVCERLEGDGQITVDVRVIAASSRSLVEAMKEGRFRVDLYYKLKVVSLHLPPLRERKADVRLLSDFFIRKYSRLEHRAVKPIATAAYERLLHHHWPGNVRELENAIHMAVVLSRESEIIPEDFPSLNDARAMEQLDMEHARQEYRALFERMIHPVFAQVAGSVPGRVYADFTSVLEEVLVDAALEATDKNQVRAAQLLGISRNTLRERMRRSTAAPVGA
ncbi:MAG: sigma-54-dependent Fis family transcriptional regulator [candidate division Zixibacteria bacterium]|nr:sigma-54-dependent Fis family transcriptional regulator [candidate division Zixibacteria bacterium]